MTAAFLAISYSYETWLKNQNYNLNLDQIINLTLLIAALIIFVLSIFKAHRLLKYIPNLVISGFVNGIALLIIISQFTKMTGLNNWLLMLITMLVAITISKLANKLQGAWQKLFSSSFLVILIMTLLAQIAPINFAYLPMSASLSELKINLPSLEQVDFSLLIIVLPMAIELALIAFLDTIMTAIIMNKKSPKNHSQLGREISGQSVSMAAVGFLGGIPGAQSTVPSMLLYQEGGNHRYSKLLIAGFCLGLTFALANLLEYIPVAVFGGVILKVAFDIADFTSIKSLISCPKGKRLARLIVLVGTCVITVFIGLNIAVIIFTLIYLFWNKFFPKHLTIPDLQENTESEGFIDER
jgi:SulP family sulfate permease